MPKYRIHETDNTGSVSLPSAEHAVYIPGLMLQKLQSDTWNAHEPAKYYEGNGSLVKATYDANTNPNGIHYDTDCLSYKLATYLQDRLGMSVVYEGIAPTEITDGKIPASCWTDLTKNIDKLPVRFLTTGQFGLGGGIDGNEINCAIARKDCTALVDLKTYQGAAGSDLKNYILLTSEDAPEDWNTAEDKYYKQDQTYTINSTVFAAEVEADPSFVPNFNSYTFYDKVTSTASSTDKYLPVTVKPADWNTSWVSYYIYKVTYTAIEDLTGGRPTYAQNTYYLGQESFSSYSITAIREAFQTASSEYAAGFTPNFITKVEALFTEADKVNKSAIIPASFGFLFAYARMIQTYPEWIATAGAVNGLIPELYETIFQYSDADAQLLLGFANANADTEDDLSNTIAGVAINPILEEYPFGKVIWGSRTLRNNEAKELKALSFLNIRNLVSTIKKVLRKAARRFTFSQNTDTLWYNFRSMIEPTLESMKNGNGIAGYLIEQLPTTAKARLKAKITIIPIEPVEDFDLEIVLTDSIAVNE